MPRLGGQPSYLDVVGVNIYANNQFLTDGTTVQRGDSGFKPLSEMLIDIHRRYRRPLLISETGAEGPSARRGCATWPRRRPHRGAPKGRVVEIGTHDELLGRGGVYTGLIKKQLSSAAALGALGSCDEPLAPAG